MIQTRLFKFFTGEIRCQTITVSSAILMEDLPVPIVEVLGRHTTGHTRALLRQDQEWEIALDEARLFDLPKQMRMLFEMILCNGQPTNFGSSIALL
jgi:hypothetical protein